jgi:hypothetical protein
MDAEGKGDSKVVLSAQAIMKEQSISVLKEMLSKSEVRT